MPFAWEGEGPSDESKYRELAAKSPHPPIALQWAPTLSRFTGEGKESEGSVARESLALVVFMV